VSKERCEAYLPGTGDTLGVSAVFNKGVLPEQDLSIALPWAETPVE